MSRIEKLIAAVFAVLIIGAYAAAVAPILAAR